MNSSIPAWCRRRFGDDAVAIQAAVWEALKDTEEATLDVQAVARSKKRFAAGGARMTNQFERLVERVIDLGVEGTEVVKTGTWYELPLVHNTLLYPVRADVDGDEPDDQWPLKQLSNLVQELFAATDSSARRWVADTFAGLELTDLELRPSLAELAGRDPNPGLVLIVFEMDSSGLKRIWWGQADLLDGAGTLRWVTERSLLTNPLGTPLFLVGPGSEDDRFDSGDLPDVPMAGRSDAERKQDVPPKTEKADEIEDDAAESDEH